MTKAHILDIEGKKTKEIDMPSFFSERIREDLIAKVLESKKRIQPFAPSLWGGMNSSAHGKIVHRRHVWKSGYGRGISRIPRKIMLRRGSQFQWVGATVPFARGGRRAHPPKLIKKMIPLKINKKEMIIALKSALSATADENKVIAKYQTLSKDKKIKNLPIIVEGKITSLKTKELISSLKKILGDELFVLALKNKSERAGKGKMRARRYKENAGLLLVVGEKEKPKISGLDIRKAKNINVTDLASGKSGRLTVYTENAIKELNERFSNKEKSK